MRSRHCNGRVRFCRPAFGIFCLLSALCTASCAGRPEGVLAPVAASTLVPSDSMVDMLVATSRQLSGDPATLFTGDAARTCG